MNRRISGCRECGLCEVEPVGSAAGTEISALVESVVRNVVEEVLQRSPGRRMVPVGVSARHLHIKQEDLEVLFGPGASLTKLKDLNQPGEFAAKETVAVVGPKRRLFENVRILGPVRSKTQVELSYTDGVYLGMDLPHRISGDLKGTAPLILMGPKGVLHLDEGGIRAARHIHMSPETAVKLGVESGQIVSVRTIGPASVSFNNVVIRTGKNLNLEMHIDTDEANAAGLHCGDRVELLD